MDIIKYLPIEIKSKIFIYLSHPVADLIREPFIKTKCHIGKCYVCNKHGRHLYIDYCMMERIHVFYPLQYMPHILCKTCYIKDAYNASLDIYDFEK